MPLEINRLDDEAQCRTDSVDILLHDSFDDGRFSSIVKSSLSVSSVTNRSH